MMPDHQFNKAQAPDFCAFILAGGKSRRMGTNKALLKHYEDGPTLVERVVENVRLAGPRQIYIIADNPSPLEFLQIPIIRDEVSGIGPLGGILSGLRASACERNFVVACDMPGIDPKLIAFMASIKDEYDAIVPRWVDNKGNLRVEPLHAIYMRSALTALCTLVASGQTALHACLNALNVRYVEERDLSRFGISAHVFRNVNSPSDWLDFLSDRP